MRNIYIEFTRPHKDFKTFPLLSWAIRFFEGTKYSHVRLTWLRHSDSKIVYEASGSSVKFIGKKAQQKKKADVIDSFEIDISKEEYRELVDACHYYADTSYGMLQIFGIMLTYLPWFKNNPFSDGERSQVCSELVARILKSVKNIDVGSDLDLAGPKAINGALTKLIETRQDIRKGFIADN
jgi:hypothetical protein